MFAAAVAVGAGVRVAVGEGVTDDVAVGSTDGGAKEDGLGRGDAGALVVGCDELTKATTTMIASAVAATSAIASRVDG